jgi:hypothetical protein
LFCFVMTRCSSPYDGRCAPPNPIEGRRRNCPPTFPTIGRPRHEATGICASTFPDLSVGRDLCREEPARATIPAASQPLQRNVSSPYVA